MKYYNLRDKNYTVNFATALFSGLAPDNGLFMPTEIPSLSIWGELSELTPVEIGTAMLSPFVSPSIDEATLSEILSETLSFEMPIVHIENNRYCLELFHGPTKAFKDVGARFISRCFANLREVSSPPITVLTATSGDTGSAVAHGFHNVEGIDVKILFPKNGVSLYQEKQMTSLGGNIEVFEVDGTFDDCQKLVKTALSDSSLHEYVTLSSANSINVARFLPQMIYYALALRQLYIQEKIDNPAEALVYSVPSGNFGNLTAGVLAHKMGLPAKRFIAACNANDAVYQYLQTGHYQPKDTIETIANAMDVGDPSNFYRLIKLLEETNNREALLSATSYDDNTILKSMRQTYFQSDYILDPHAAVAYQSLIDELEENELGVFLGTAAPIKFDDIVRRVIPDYKAEEIDLSDCHKTSLQNDYSVFKSLIIS